MTAGGGNPTSSRGRVLVTGASGHIGSHLIQAATQRGWDVVAWTHRTPVPSCQGPGVVQPMSGDIRDTQAMRAVIADVDAICHLAAFIPPDFRDPAHAEACLQINALATLQLALAAVEKGIPIVYCSSAQAYAFSRLPVKEDAAQYPAERATYYLASKLAGELYVENLRRTRGLGAFTFRIASCYGPGMTERSAVSAFMRNAMAGKPIVVQDGGLPVFDFVCVRDIAKLILSALESKDGGDQGVYNAGSGISTSVLGLAEAVRNTFPERKIEIDIVAPGKIVPSGFSPLSMTRTHAVFHHTPTPLSEGLHAYRQHLEASSR